MYVRRHILLVVISCLIYRLIYRSMHLIKIVSLYPYITAHPPPRSILCSRDTLLHSRHRHRFGEQRLLAAACSTTDVVVELQWNIADGH